MSEANGNWARLGKIGGVIKALSDIMTSASCTPSARGPLLVVASDYSGSHDASRYDVYSVLVADWAFCDEWEVARRAVRDRFLVDHRRMSYKSLNDRRRQSALGPFLNAARLIPGLLICLGISKGVRTIFEACEAPISSGLSECLSWKTSLLERTLRVIHVVSFSVAGMSRAHQDVFWFSDEDEIAANENQLRLLTKVWANIQSNYLSHSLRHLRCGTTLCDTGANDIEDLTAIPDLAAGAVADLLTRASGAMHTDVITPMPVGTKYKAMFIGNWLSREPSYLRKIVLRIDKESDSDRLVVGHVRLHQL